MVAPNKMENVIAKEPEARLIVIQHEFLIESFPPVFPGRLVVI
jgi:hypothetical protein